MMILLLTACGGSGSDKQVDVPEPILPPTSLPEVNDYQLKDTAQVLADVNSQLQGLPVDDFFEQAFWVISLRNSEAILADGNFDLLDLATVELDNISDEYREQSKAVFQEILLLLQQFDVTTLSHAQKLSYDIFMADLQTKIGWITYKNYEYPATYGFFGWPGATESFFTEVYTFSTKAQAQGYLTLLNQLGRRFDQIEVLLAARKASGIIEPKITLDYSRSLVAAMANSAVTATSYYQAFDTQISAISDISDADKSALREQLTAIIEQRVLPAYQSLAGKMSALVAEAPDNIGFGQFSGGSEFYQFSLNTFTSSELTAEQVHQLGLDELSRIHTEMRALFDLLGYPQNETLAQLYRRVDTDAGIIAASDAKATFENIIAQAYSQLPNLFERLPVQEVIVVGGNSGGYYISGSDDGSRPGAFYANTVADQAYTTMPTLAYHEAVPGHHLQIALANEMDLPQFRRKGNFTSFIEGWGLYAERLAKESGWYVNDPYGDLGRLQYEAMRAARLVVDTGIHAKGWSYNQANQFHVENVGFDGSIARYSVWPGQATAYMSGMLKILELRALGEQELGELYDIREFHSAVVGNGSMPLNILTQVVNDYIANKLAVTK